MQVAYPAWSKKVPGTGQAGANFLEGVWMSPQDALGYILLLTSGCGTAQGNLFLGSGKIVLSQQLSVYWKAGDSN